MKEVDSTRSSLRRYVFEEAVVNSVREEVHAQWIIFTGNERRAASYRVNRTRRHGVKPAWQRVVERPHRDIGLQVLNLGLGKIPTAPARKFLSATRSIKALSGLILLIETNLIV